MASNALFRRAWCLTISPRGQSQAPFEFSSQPLVGQPLRLTFDIEQTLHSNSNKATIVLYNLRPETIAAIDRGATIYLACSYGPTKPDRRDNIFLGQVMERTTRKDGADYATELTCGDSEYLLQCARVGVSISTQTTVSDVLSQITKQLNITYGGESIGLLNLNLQGDLLQKVNRFYAAGPAKEVLNSLLQHRKIDWCIQGGTLLVQERNFANDIPAVVLSAASGLLERPIPSAKGIQFKALIQSTIRPGYPVRIESADLTGEQRNFRVVKATYHGDTHGDEWIAEVYADPLKKILDTAEAPQDAKAKPGAAAQDVAGGDGDEDDIDDDEVES